MIISLDKYKGSGGGEKPTEVLTKTITENGSQTFNPQAGYVFSKATITTDVHPKDALVATINENGSHHFDGEYNGADITTDVHPTQALIATINENGSHSFTGEYNGAEITVGVPTPEGNVDINANGIYNVTNYVTATVNVQPSNNYSYFDGVVDVEGLKAIGWDDASIGYLRDNERHYAWQNRDYIVSEENKALNGVIVDKTSIKNNKDNPNFKYCPFFDTSNITGMDNMFFGCKFLTSIPQLNTSNVTNMNSMFQGCRSLKAIPQLDTSNVLDMSWMFYGCSSLTSIALLDTSKVTNMSYFFGWSNIDTLTYLGGFNNLSINVESGFLERCPNLTVESLMNVINNLATVSGRSLKFGSTNLNKLTAEQKAIATNKGWTLSA